MGVLTLDHLHFWCADAKQLSAYYCTSFGFIPAGQCLDIEGRNSFAITQHSITFIFTTATSTSDLTFSEALKNHGDAVRDVALSVDDVYESHAHAVSNGAISIVDPYEVVDEQGTIVLASLRAPCGDLVHTLVDRSKYNSCTLPGFLPTAGLTTGIATGNRNEGMCSAVDHIAIACPKDSIFDVLSEYKQCYGLDRFRCQDEEEGGLDVDGEEGGLKTVVASTNSAFKIVIVEPKQEESSNQVQQFLESHSGPGVQHVAMHTDDIVSTVRSIKTNGVEFIHVPHRYYASLNIGDAFPIGELEELAILVDANRGHYLLQTFTRTLHTRPTFFMEIISRKGADGFGKRNIKALFKAIELLQRDKKEDAE